MLNVTEEFENLKKEFTEHEESWAERAQTAEQELDATKKNLAELNEHLSKIVTAVFGKNNFFILSSVLWQKSRL